MRVFQPCSTHTSISSHQTYCNLEQSYSQWGIRNNKISSLPYNQWLWTNEPHLLLSSHNFLELSFTFSRGYYLLAKKCLFYINFTSPLTSDAGHWLLLLQTYLFNQRCLASPKIRSPKGLPTRSFKGCRWEVPTHLEHPGIGTKIHAANLEFSWEISTPQANILKQSGTQGARERWLAM